MGGRSSFSHQGPTGSNNRHREQIKRGVRRGRDQTKKTFAVFPCAMPTSSIWCPLPKENTWGEQDFVKKASPLHGASRRRDVDHVARFVCAAKQGLFLPELVEARLKFTPKNGMRAKHKKAGEGKRPPYAETCHARILTNPSVYTRRKS